MVRTTSYRTQHPMRTEYVHRVSTYTRRANYVDLDHAESLFQEETVTDPLENFVLPPKQPTPNVILRDDIMPQQRTTVAL